jgi:hypothetical protein
MTREQLMDEARRLRAGTRAHRDSAGHALCWHHPRLWGLYPRRRTPCRRSLHGRSFCGAASSTDNLRMSNSLTHPVPMRRISRDGAIGPDCSGPPNITFEQTTGSHSLAAAGQRER